MEIELNKDVIYVSGQTNGAIYNFTDGRVYHLNRTACKIVVEYANGMIDIDGNEYLCTLLENHLISRKFVPRVVGQIKKVKTRKLEMAWLELTEACNLKCIHCYEGSCHKNKDNSLKLNEWKDVISQLSCLNINRIILIGGEPSCYKHIDEIVEFCGKQNLNITYFTNATLLTDHLVELFAKYNVQVKISIYGFDEASHDAITLVPGSFKRTFENIKKLKKFNIKTYASVILMKENQNFLDNILEFLKKNEIVYTGYDVVRQVYGQNQNVHCPTNKEIISNRFMVKPNFKADKMRYLLNHYFNSCWNGKIAIKENGDVIPCVFHRDEIIGNVNTKSIKEIINSKEIKKFWDLDFSKIDKCSNCEYRYACKDCRVVAFGNNGDFYSKNPRCKYNPEKGKWENN